MKSKNTMMASFGIAHLLTKKKFNVWLRRIFGGYEIWYRLCFWRFRWKTSKTLQHTLTLQESSTKTVPLVNNYSCLQPHAKSRKHFCLVECGLVLSVNVYFVSLRTFCHAGSMWVGEIIDYCFVRNICVGKLVDFSCLSEVVVEWPVKLLWY